MGSLIMTNFSTPSFWRWNEWSNLWPPHDNDTNSASFDISLCSKDFQSLWQKCSNILYILQDNPGFHKPVTLFEVRDLATKIACWIESDSYEIYTTIPPTNHGFHQAIAQLLVDKNLEISIVLAIVRPKDLIAAIALVSDDNLSNDWKKIRNHYISTDQIKASLETKKEDSETKVLLAQKNNGKNELPEKHRIDGLRFSKWLEETEEMQKRLSLPSAAIRELWNRYIKSDIIENKGIGEHAANYWFEDIALPALCTLNIRQLEKIVEYWPEHSKVTWNSPENSMENPLFWRAIRSLKQPERNFMLENLLPSLVISDNWSFKNRFKMLSSMVDRTKDHGWLFEERLKLWISWGGNLDLSESVVDYSSEQQSVFVIPKTQSARQWLIEQKNPLWTDILINKFAPQISEKIPKP